jgi:hypothetical protein
MRSDQIAARCELLSGSTELYLRVIDPGTLGLLCDLLREIPSSGEMKVLPNTHFEAADESYSQVLLKVGRTGRAERIHVENNPHEECYLLWEDDKEYWLECAEKVDRLLEAKSGHQYLIVRGSANGGVTLSYREE